MPKPERRAARGSRDWLPLAASAAPREQPPTGEAFRPEWIDFGRGIRVGNLEPHERITRILKYRLEQRYGTPFTTDRWGRGVFWQWICWLPKANRAAKPLSSDVNFGCAKLFICADGDRREFQAGLQVERGYLRDSGSYPGCVLKRDWDWHRLAAQFRAKSGLDGELRRLLHKEGFVVEVGGGPAGATRLAGRAFRTAVQLQAAAAAAPAADWASFQLFYPMPERELLAISGNDLVSAILATFTEVTPAMNLCMQVPLVRHEAGPRFRFR